MLELDFRVVIGSNCQLQLFGLSEKFYSAVIVVLVSKKGRTLQGFQNRDLQLK